MIVWESLKTTPKKSLIQLTPISLKCYQWNTIDEIYLSLCAEEGLKTKNREPEQRKIKKVINEINDRQKCTSLYRLIKSETIDSKPEIKAYRRAWRLEEQNYCTHGPTCSREFIHIFFSLPASKRWTVNSLDVRTAFIQGNNLEQTVLVRPSKKPQTNKILKIKKCVNGLAEASCYWYLKVRQELCKLGGRLSKLEQGLFYFSKGQWLIYAVLFVDDLLWGGKQIFTQTISKFKNIFQIGSENYSYAGIKH